MADGLHRNLRLGSFELSGEERALRREGVMLPLGSGALDIPIYLAEPPGESMAKQELLDRVWSVRSGSYKMRTSCLAPSSD